MEIGSECTGISITIAELIDLIPEETWKKIENNIRIQACQKIGRTFSTIEYWDGEGKLEFGVST